MIYVHYYYYSKVRYKRTVIKGISKLYGQYYGQLNNLKFEINQLVKVDAFSTTTYAYENIEIVEEINDYFYIKIKSGLRIIIPKTAFSNVEIYKFFKDLILEKNLKMVNEKKWKW